MAALAGLLGIATLLLVAAGIVALILPQFASRRHLGRNALLLAGVALVGGMIVMPKNSTADRSDKGQQTSNPEQVAATKSRVDDGEQTKAAFVTLYRFILTETKPCEGAVEELGKVAKSGDQYGTYNAAKDGAETCRSAAAAIGGAELPSGLSEPGKAATDKALGLCKNANLYRQMAFETAMQVADGDSKPSTVSDAADKMKAGQMGSILCVGQLFTAASVAGVDTKLLK